MTQPEQENRHWADVAADEILRIGRTPLISTGISPSGEIHIGNMREVLTADAVYRVLVEREAEVRFNYVADNFDPLRKVYPFLDKSVFEPCVGKPLSEIPCPCGEHSSYSEHFLQPFLQSLQELRIDVELERADQMYKSGRMTPYIIQALEQRDRIAAILHELTGKEMPPTWSPWMGLCPSCGRMNQNQVRGFSSKDETVDLECGCGFSGTVPMAGGGKLTWRVDWPARWAMFGVTVEPFGKDHATRGGSYDTGARLSREVFDHEPPFPIPYEWIRLKGKGDMSSSKGNVHSIGQMLEVVPPEALRYLVIRDRPTRTIGFDPGLPLLQLVDEVDDATAKGRNDRAIELSQAGGFQPVGVPFKHLVVVAQVADFDADRVLQILQRSGYPEAGRDEVQSRMQYAQNWLAAYAPEDVRFRVQPELPSAAQELGAEQREFLERLGGGLRPGMDGGEIHDLIYALASEFSGVKPALLFQAIYLSVLGKPRGPRAGWFLSLLGAEFTATRFREAAKGSS